ncbi:MAG: hypothetical protein JW751_06535 [Polyangiaceae bacterium]|nr:hypothetical protein [Polyangiaceae bacterium]
MRLGLLGPAEGNTEALERAARFVFRDLVVDRVVYLGVDGALDEVVRRWAAALVGPDPSETGIWRRAQRCMSASAAEIEDFVSRERERRSLQVFEALPSDGTRTIELVAGKVAVMIHDKDDLDEEDMLPATFLLFGASVEPVVRRIGARWFLSPGSIEDFGVLLLEECGDDVELTLYDTLCRPVRTERLFADNGLRMTVK